MKRTKKETDKILAEMDRICSKSKLTEKDVKELAEKVDAAGARRFKAFLREQKQKKGKVNKK